MMPQYDYKCSICEKERIVIHRINESPVIRCICGSEMKRIIKKAPAFKINGYFTSKTGYSKDPQYMKMVEQKRKRERQR